MITYHKIQTVFLRDPDTNFKKLLEGQFAKPEFEYLANNQWHWTEKVDGMNIRVMFTGEKVYLAGKSDNAAIHPHLTEQLQSLFPLDKMQSVFGSSETGESLGICLYGEGFGAGIQSGGYYQQNKDFILFDVKIGDLWLERPNIEDVANKLDCRIVPVVGTGSLSEAVEFARTGYKSTIANEAHVAEGLIMKPTTELINRRGERVISKIKFKDFS